MLTLYFSIKSCVSIISKLRKMSIARRDTTRFESIQLTCRQNFGAEWILILEKSAKPIAEMLRIQLRPEEELSQV